MKKIGYNNQINNIIVTDIKGSSQCFATAAWMFMSFYDPNIDANDDEGLSTYIDDITRTGKAHEFEYAAHFALITKYFQRDGIMGKLKLGIDLQSGVGLTSPDDLRALLQSGPVIIGTRHMANLPGGHMILAIDNNPEDGGIICHDPFGNANSSYADKNGEGVIYSIEMFNPKFPDGPIPTIFFEV